MQKRINFTPSRIFCEAARGPTGLPLAQPTRKGLPYVPEETPTKVGVLHH